MKLKVLCHRRIINLSVWHNTKEYIRYMGVLKCQLFLMKMFFGYRMNKKKNVFLKNRVWQVVKIRVCVSIVKIGF